MSFQTIAEDLLKATDSSRTTIRFDTPDDPYFPVVAEAVAPGVRSIKDDRIESIREAPTFLYLEKELEILVQSDTTTSLAGCPALIDIYGVRAQMLAPIVESGRLTGIISVHQTDGVREWSEEDIAALKDATGRVYRELDQTAVVR